MRERTSSVGGASQPAAMSRPSADPVGSAPPRHYLERELYERLRSDSEIFEFLEAGSLDGVWYWDLENPEHEWMSAAFWTTLGFDPAERAHRAEEWQDLIDPEDLETAARNFQRHCEDPAHPYDQLVRYRHRLGHTVWVRCRGLAIRDPEGRPVRMLGAHNDLTSLMEAREELQLRFEQLDASHRELKNTEALLEHRVEERTVELVRVNRRLRAEIEERARAEEALAVEKERAEITLHSIGDAVITTDAEGMVQYMNPVAETLTGWTDEEARGGPLARVFRIFCESTGTAVPSPVAQCLEDGRVVGLGKHTALKHRNGEIFSIQDSAAPIRRACGEIVGVVMVFSDVTEARRLEEEISHQASHDALTGLVNRREFEVRLRQVLARERRPGTEHALCYLDLDQFKIINDTCGHVAGDELLRQLGELLRGGVRQQDTLARLGGDEFGLLMECCTARQAERVARGLLGAIENYRFIWKGQGFSVRASLGVVPIPADGATVEEVLSAADSACYAAKDGGRNRIHTYREDDAELALRHGEMRWVARVHRALEEHRFQLCFQPILPIQEDGENGTRGEILLRMKDEEGRIVLPGAFLPAVERYSLTYEVDSWVVRATLEWLAAHPCELARLELCSINLSGPSLSGGTLLDYIEEQLDRSGVEPHKICFEITETAAIGNLTNAGHFIKVLHARGCKFALDDFGAGLCSFAYLKHLPVDYLKIDGQFVKEICTDPVDLAMVRSINEIGHTLNTRTVAEFVESESILEKLRELGVDYAQGYETGSPIPIDDLTLAAV